MTDITGDRPMERLAYSVDEAAAITGLSRDLLYDQMRIGRLAYLKIGRRRIITRQHLEAFLTRNAPKHAVSGRSDDGRQAPI
jgi:excisionase family DNA binding protein